VAARPKLPVRTAWSTARIAGLSSLFTCASAAVPQLMSPANCIEASKRQRNNVIFFVASLNPDFEAQNHHDTGSNDNSGQLWPCRTRMRQNLSPIRHAIWHVHVDDGRLPFFDGDLFAH
jgi:hypothetical protein